MKEKLQKIRTALIDNTLLSAGYADTASTALSKSNFLYQLEFNKSALALIDEIIATLDSKELVKGVGIKILDAQGQTDDILILAKAAIEALKAS